MTEHNELVMALLTNAHCSLKAAYMQTAKVPSDDSIQNEILNIFDLYADSDVVFKRLKASDE